MKKTLCILLSLFLLSFAGCKKQYREEDFLGKNSRQIVSEFGPFDLTPSQIPDDGLYRNATCGYTVREPQVGFLGTSPEVLFFITFDENGIAVTCSEGYRPGG